MFSCISIMAFVLLYYILGTVPLAPTRICQYKPDSQVNIDKGWLAT